MPVLIRYILDCVDFSALKLSGRAGTRIARAAHQAVGQYWFDHFLYRHFEGGAAGKYGYKPRSAGYLAQKRKLAAKGKAIAGGQVPLLLTGLMRSMIKEWAMIRAYPSRVTVTMHGPRYVSMRPKKPGHPAMGVEITTVTEEERRKLSEVFKEAVAEGINREKANLKTRVS